MSMGIAPLLGCVVELAFFDPVEEALPLVPVVDENALSRVIGYPHEYPLASRGGRRGAETDEGDLDGSGPAARPLPVQRPDVDAELFHRGLTGRRGLPGPGGLAGVCGHGRPATPQ